MIAELIAVIGGEDNHGGVQQPSIGQEAHQDADLVVYLFDQAHIGGDDPTANLIT
jgi:hypothetical protein